MLFTRIKDGETTGLFLSVCVCSSEALFLLVKNIETPLHVDSTVINKQNFVIYNHFLIIYSEQHIL